MMHSLKRYTSREANKFPGRTGQFWRPESYDHIVRDKAELERIILYMVNNSVSAGLVQDWRDWPWTYCRFAL